jgi:hypothetical protein
MRLVGTGGRRLRRARAGSQEHQTEEPGAPGNPSGPGKHGKRRDLPLSRDTGRAGTEVSEHLGVF